jgi:hypothetical protein
VIDALIGETNALENKNDLARHDELEVNSSSRSPRVRYSTTVLYIVREKQNRVKFDIPVVCWSKRKGSITPQEDPVYGRIWAHLGIEQVCFKRS